MDIKADITWIKSELDKVTDPHLVEAFKSMLNFRSSVKAESTQTEMEQMILEGEDDILNGRVHTTDEVRQAIAAWKK